MLQNILSVTRDQTRPPRGVKDAREDRGWHQVTLGLGAGFLEERAGGQGGGQSPEGQSQKGFQEEEGGGGTN